MAGASSFTQNSWVFSFLIQLGWYFNFHNRTSAFSNSEVNWGALLILGEAEKQKKQYLGLLAIYGIG